uniref:FAST kinase domain-containing protein 5 n=1 Tax=Aceria tosichella TaxID=561515 RepID=A0A6G1SKK5_9ACAR
MHRLRIGLFTRGHEKYLLRLLSSESVAAVRYVNDKPRYRLPSATISQSQLKENQELIIPMQSSNGISSQTNHDHENEYIYKYIHRRLYERFSDIDKKVLNLPVNQYIVKLKELLQAEEKNEDQISDICSEIKSQIQYMNQLELTSLLSSIKGEQASEFKNIIKLIDMELRWLLKKHVKTRLMDLDLWLYIADLFYECRIKSRFTHVLVNYLANEPDVEMSNRQVLHLLFLVVLKRYQDTLLEKYEAKIFKLLSRATFEDLAIVCLAYFKTKTPIQNPELLSRIVDLTAENLSTLDPQQPGYCSIVKSIRYSRTHQCRENVMHMILTLTEDLNHRIIFASPYNAVHTIKLMETFRIYDPKLLHMFRNTLFQNLEEFRIKDIQYALTSLSNFAYQDLKLDQSLRRDFKKLANSIVNEKREDVEYQYYHLMPILRAFSMFQYYDDDFITYTNKVLADEDKFNRMKTVLEFEKSALVAYVSSHIDNANVKLQNTSGIFRELCSNIVRSSSMGSVKQDYSLAYLDYLLRGPSLRKGQNYSILYHSIATSLAATEELKDPVYRFYFQYTFPHQNYNDLMITKSLEDRGSFHPFTLLPRQVPPDEKVCMIYATRKADFIDGYNRLSGYKQTMIRLSSKLGYTVLPVDLHQPDIKGLASLVRSVLET